MTKKEAFRSSFNALHGHMDDKRTLDADQNAPYWKIVKKIEDQAALGKPFAQDVLHYIQQQHVMFGKPCFDVHIDPNYKGPPKTFDHTAKQVTVHMLANNDLDHIRAAQTIIADVAQYHLPETNQKYDMRLQKTLSNFKESAPENPKTRSRILDLDGAGNKRKTYIPRFFAG